MTKARSSADFAAGGFFAGKNAIINGDMSIWQRGTSYNAPVTPSYGAADRYTYYQNGSTAGTNTISRQTFTPGTAPVSGYEAQFFQRWTATTLGTGQTLVSFQQGIENVQTFAGQTATISYWAKSSAAFTTDVTIRQNFGSGGSGSVDTTTGTSTTSTSWTRFTFTVNIPSISGKTIGTSSQLLVAPRFYTITAGATVDIWGLQMEPGSVATPFETATGTIQGELAACQRYYWRDTAGNAYSGFGTGTMYSTTNLFATFPLPVTMRVAPSLSYSTLEMLAGGGVGAVSGVNSNRSTTKTGSQEFYAAAAFATTGHAGVLRASNSTSAYMEWSAEL